MPTALDKITEKEDKSKQESVIQNGIAFHGVPLDQRIVHDFTTPVGMSSSILIGYYFYLGKRGYRVVKVEDWMEISPVHAQFYQITIQQKQQLEQQIKSGLAGISTSISDFELLLHDLRRYREFMEIFETIKRSKTKDNKEEMMKGEQSLKAIFIDEVDVHTGEGIALKLIAPRWPTIIADFMRLKDEDTNPSKIATDHRISEAEGVVLATKNKLYLHWKGVFEDTVLRRYAQLVELSKARLRSIQEYKNMLKPYVARYRSIREFGEVPAGRGELAKVSWYRPAAHAVSVDNTLTWAWHPLVPSQLAKPARGGPIETVGITKMPFQPKVKAWIKGHMEKLKAEDIAEAEGMLKDEDKSKARDSKNLKSYNEFIKKYSEMKTSPVGIEPLDDFVLRQIKVIQDTYKIEFKVEDILDVRDAFVDYCIESHVTTAYFTVMEIGASRTVIKPPQGEEIEDMWLEPFQVAFDSQNFILLRYLELKAKELELENYIDEMIGKTPDGTTIKELLEIGERLCKPVGIKDLEGKKEATILEKALARTTILDKIKSFFSDKLGFGLGFFRPNPYEISLDDELTSIYIPEIVSTIYHPSIEYLRSAHHVPGYKAAV